jgi:hypothetical protein
VFQDCSSEQKSSFICPGGLQDGQKTESLTEGNCHHHVSESPYSEWLYHFCYVITHTPYLGQYFVTQKKVDTLAEFSDSLVSKKNIFNFKTRNVDAVSDSNAHYKYGSLVKILYLNSEGFLGNRPRHLVIPANMFYPNGGICIDSTPVRFLVNRGAHCIRAISRNRCEKAMNSPFSAQSHIADSMSKTSDISGFLHVAKDSLGQNSVQTEIKFLCFNNGSDYVTFPNSVFRSNVSDILFNHHILEDDLSLCKCSGSVEDILMTSYDEEREVCRNVLISVSYDFIWKGTDILNLTATYILADVPVTPFAFITLKNNISELGGSVMNSFIMPRYEAMDQGKLYVSQRFVAKFRHYKSIHMLDVNISAGEDAGTYLGNHGYKIGHPVVALRKNDTLLGWEEGLLEVWGNGKYITYNTDGIYIQFLVSSFKWYLTSSDNHM